MHNIVVMTMDCNDLDRHAVHADRVMNLSPTAFSYWDRDLQCCYANDACIDWFGIEPEILVGSCLEDVLDILRLESHFALVDAALQGERRSIVQTFHDGLAKRDGLVQYLPDARGHLVSGLLIQVSPTFAAPRFVPVKR